MLINNAGIALYDDLTDRSVLERQLGVNLFGPYEVIQAFLPQLTGSRGTIVNNLSINAFAPLPVIPAYSISKAAAFSLTQALRALLAGRRDEGAGAPARGARGNGSRPGRVKAALRVIVAWAASVSR